MLKIFDIVRIFLENLGRYFIIYKNIKMFIYLFLIMFSLEIFFKYILIIDKSYIR